MHSKCDNKEITVNDKADEVIEKFLKLLFNRFENKLSTFNESDFVLGYVNLLYYKCHKINPNRGGSYIGHI